ncbi:MAG TPA: circularly permuted type 2 ATP-grasp protein [Solirubrobacterales bacterium]|nr:circularly permuted type 2 ATP-grasp protein [Solirubrobacterales bacterium]
MSAPSYSPEPDCLDEAYEPDGTPRPLYAGLLEELGRDDLVQLSRRVEAQVEARGLTFGEGEPIAVDPVPRLIGAAEWERLEAGLLQRARALNAFIVDAYGSQRIFDVGVVPRRLLETSGGYLEAMVGLMDPEAAPATVAGLDLVRDRNGEFVVLEDNLRMPSGAAYAFAVREIVEPEIGVTSEPHPLAGYVQQLGAAIRTAAPPGRDEPLAIVLSDGPESSSAWYEHERIGRELGIPIVQPDHLQTSRGRLFARISGQRRQVDVVYRRQDADHLTDPDGRVTELGELLLPALRSGRLRCVNAFGSGLADDKLAYAYVERMIDFYLGETPLLRSVPTYDLSDPSAREEAMDRLDELVIKPRGGSGGQGVTIMPRASEPARKRAIGVVRRRPERFIAQEPVAISSHPTIRGAGLQPRRVDLRPFVISTPAGEVAMPGGLTRFARGSGEMVVNSSQGGGCKDTWVVDNAQA